MVHLVCPLVRLKLICFAFANISATVTHAFAGGASLVPWCMLGTDTILCSAMCLVPLERSTVTVDADTGT